MSTLERAIELAAHHHAGQVDKVGEPYILHPLRVMLALSSTYADCRMVAVLHDAVEDSNLSLEDLSEAGFPNRVVTALDALTRRDDETYASYIHRCNRDPLARTVKMGDVMDNFHRVHLLDDDEAWSLTKRYAEAWRILTDGTAA